MPLPIEIVDVDVVGIAPVLGRVVFAVTNHEWDPVDALTPMRFCDFAIL